MHKYCIAIDKIEYFLTDGDIYTSTSVSGGGGTVGGVSLGGAIVGGILGGEAGAIIGSRKEGVINEVRSYTKVHDEKYLLIKYRDGDDKLKEIRFDEGYSEVCDVLKTLIPEKDYKYVIKRSGETQPDAKRDSSPTDRLAELKKLYESELISLEEYENKKSEILKML